MKGRFLATIVALCFSTSVCFSQMYDPSRNPFGSRSHSDFGRSTSFSGIVIGSDGKPVGNARVEVRNLQTGSTIASGYTTSGGSFEFENLPAASYEVSASQGL